MTNIMKIIKPAGVAESTGGSGGLYASGQPTLEAFKGNGRDVKFKFRHKGREISVWHNRGKSPRAAPSRINKRSVTFEKPPQKGDSIIVLYTME